MLQATDKIISKVFKGPSGESEYGPWQLYNIYFEGHEQKFGYMQSGKKPVPVKGMEIAYVEYEKEVKGKYTNYNIKTLKLKDSPKAQIQTTINDQGGGSHTYINHGEVALKIMELADFNDDRIVDLSNQFNKTIDLISGSSPALDENEGFDEMNPPPIEDEDIPI